ncbi:hypothetical protein ACFFJX_14800 [Pseudarcicella hirudinis]|uniref:hypothetical protein n=1 Tax=Pseudarcicella hirudinis TaxID=1079859 RepID=UPI0035EC8B87
MKKTILINLILFILSFNVWAQPIQLKTDELSLNISSSGQITTMMNPKTGKNYLAIGERHLY